MTEKRADLLMVFITIIWGGTFPLIKNSMAYTNANWFVAMRFGFAALLLLPFVLPRLRRVNRTVLVSGALLGMLNGFGYYGQTIGLKTISSAESAFITSTTVIIVPLLAPFFKLGKPHLLELVAVVVCLLGVYLLTGANLSSLNGAAAWTFVCALTTALSIIFIQKITPKISDFLSFTFFQILFASFVPLLSSLIHHQTRAVWHFDLYLGLFYCAVLATALTFFLQSRYQQYTNPTRVGLIFTLEPVFASLFAFAFNHEDLTNLTLIGAAVILISLIIAESKNFKIFSKL